MNNQEKLNANDLQFVEKQQADYKIVYKILPAFLLLMYLFMIWASGEAFNSAFSIIFIVILTLFYGLAYWLLQTQQKMLKTDLQNGFKEIVEGVVSEKVANKRALYFKINKEKYPVVNEQYMAFEEGDNVKMEILPVSKTVLSIVAIPQ